MQSDGMRVEPNLDRRLTVSGREKREESKVDLSVLLTLDLESNGIVGVVGGHRGRDLGGELSPFRGKVREGNRGEGVGAGQRLERGGDGRGGGRVGLGPEGKTVCPV
jgi:hypothetical protein